MKTKIKDYFFKLKSSEFFKNVFTLISGNIIGYAINFLTLPFISRLYTKGELGGYDLIVSSATIFMTVLNLGLMLVIMIPKEDEKANCICKIIMFTVFIGITVSIIFFMAISPWYKFFKFSEQYFLMLFLFGIFVFLNSLQVVFYSYSNRKKLYKVLFWNPILMNSVNCGFSLLFGFLKYGTIGYLGGTLLSYVVAIIHMNRHVHPFSGKSNFSLFKETIKEYKSYPLVQMPANVLQVFGKQIPAQYLGRFFSAAELGGYAMACKILAVPVTLLATPVNRVYYRTLMEKLDNGTDEAGNFAFNLLSKNIKIALLPIGILMIFGEVITKFVLGNEWAISGVYITIMGVMYLLQYCTACISGTFVATKKQAFSIIDAVLSIIIYLICFVLAAIFGLNVVQTIILYTAFSMIYYIIELSLTMYVLHFSLLKFYVFVLKYIFFSSTIIYFIFFLVNYFTGI